MVKTIQHIKKSSLRKRVTEKKAQTFLKELCIKLYRNIVFAPAVWLLWELKVSIFDWNLIILTDNQDWHNISDEFKIKLYIVQFALGPMILFMF